MFIDIDKFGTQPLTGNLIKEWMKDIREPAVEPWFPLLALCLSLMCTPITETDTPPLGDDGQLLWPPNITNGMPTWAFRVLIALLLATLVLLYAIWIMPDDLDTIGLELEPSTKSVSKTRVGFVDDGESQEVKEEKKLSSSIFNVSSKILPVSDEHETEVDP